jgi:hypothetical protein
MARVQEIEFASRRWRGVRFACVLLVVLGVATQVPFGEALLFVAPLLLTVTYLEWRRVSGFFAAGVAPGQLVLRSLLGERTIAREDIASLRLRVDMANVVDEVLALGAEQAGLGERDSAALVHAATKYRAYVTTGDAAEYKSVRFDDEQLFYALRLALQFEE